MDFTHAEPTILHYYIPVCDSPLYEMRNRMIAYLKRNRRRSWGNPMTAYEKHLYFD